MPLNTDHVIDPTWGAGPAIEEAPAAGSSVVSSVLVAEDFAQGSRSRRGERLHHVFEQRCDWTQAYGRAGQLAVDAGDVVLTFEELDARANQLARYLFARGARPGDRIALLFDHAVHSYVAMLAVLKINAAYVPLDVGFPPDRVCYIVGDAGVRMVLSLSRVRARMPGLEDFGAELVFVDEVAELVAQHDGRRLTDVERGDPVDELAYIIYTSGSTGRPKGVAINHASICNFVRVAAEVYGIQSRDRVYQGMTLSFDFSVEEIWVPWVAGATLVPKPGGSSLLGMDLHEFLTERRVTAMCCVPTLLATLEQELPALRFLLVSGEACPQDLIARWHKPGRRFLNVYGPTEATVTATWTVVHPDRPVTIGVPLPTYSTVILDPQDPHKALPAGEVGEIGIAGIGLASGYVNRPDLTDRAFIPDFLGIAGNPSGRIYRTGDLGRVNGDGEIEYWGRIDTQVKIRGYRIELTEIESVLLQVPGIAQAVVDTYEPEPGVMELVGYYSLRTGTTRVDPEQIYTQLRSRLPAYMVPAYLERLDVIPMTTNDKADRNNLPPPSTRRGAASAGEHVAAATDTERILADALARTLGLDQVSVDSHFFDGLGANSLLMAQFSTRIRKQSDLPSVSMRDIYLNPTVRSLAATLTDAAPVATATPFAATAVKPVSTASYLLCGALQLLMYLGYAYLVALGAMAGYGWVDAATGWPDIYLRATGAGAALFVGLCLVPILAKWLLIGRWRPEEFRVWGLRYVRFWAVKTLLRFSPLQLFAGSPLYTLYLRSLGARIGKRVVVFSRNAPVCTDLLRIGDDTVIRKDCFFSGYRARAGLIQTGPITLGRTVFVGEATVLDINTSMGDGAQLGHTSSLQEFQAVPGGQCWHGSPAQRTTVEYLRVEPSRCGAVRRVVYSALQLANLLFLYLPLALGIATLVADSIVVPVPVQPTSWSFYAYQLAISAVLLFGPLVGGLVLVLTFPRLLNLLLKPDTVYPLYGLHYSVQRTIARLTNPQLLMTLTGDSAYIVHFLRALGYNLGRVVQTGSNFGVAQKHESPFLSSVGAGTMVSDGLSMINADFTSTSFRVVPVRIGPRNFIGNDVAYPAGGRTGDNCLLGTKTMIPLDGNVRENVGLLGSPCFEIPRSVSRDGSFDELNNSDELRRRLAAKRRHNTTTIGIFLLVRWVYAFCVTVIFQIAYHLQNRFGESALAAALVGSLLFGVVFFVLAERASTGFRSLRPRFCSIYDPYFWWHERFWKLGVGWVLAVFDGTPFKNTIWRMLGVRIGHRVFDDGCGIPEKTLVSIGDGAVLNAGSVIQCHSMEDGAFKSDRIQIGAGSTVGTGAFVHYGASLGDGAVLAPDSFLMKGEEVPPNARWQGNPARQIPTESSMETGRATSGTGPDPNPPSGCDTLQNSRPPRVLGVDVARGVALLGMMAVHVFATFNLNGTPTAATFIAGGRSAATFALLAGVSLAFLSGGRRVVQGRTRTAAAAGIAVRALLIGVIGLALGYTQQVDVILPFYAMLFLLAIPLLGLRPRVLVGIAGVVIVAAPVVLVATFGADLPYFNAGTNPTFGTLFEDPLGLMVELLVSGSYPVIAYIAYLLAGLAIGRLDLSSLRVARRLLGGGLALALSAWFASSLLLFHLGGLAQLHAAAGSESNPARALNVILWEPDPTSVSTWWWLALRAPHSNTPLDLLHTLGSAMAVLGIALLLTRTPSGARILRPLAAAGSMTLTFYSAHLIVLATGVLPGNPVALYLAMVVTVLIFAMVWRRWLGQGPLERLVAVAAGRARRAAASRSTARDLSGGAGGAAGAVPDEKISPSTRPSIPTTAPIPTGSQTPARPLVPRARRRR